MCGYEQEKLFIWFLVLTDETHAAISCGEKANISDAVSLALWPLSLIPGGEGGASARGQTGVVDFHVPSAVENIIS